MIPRQLSPGEADALQTAIELAVAAHRGQYRKYTGEPYVIHPLRVMIGLASEPVQVQIAAVLHDTVEDTAVTLEQIDSEFGSEVRRLVDALTRRHGEAYAHFIARIIESGPDAILLKMGDVKDNMHNG